ncbi:MAG: type II toxin-antitoxin system VapC family toxin [Terracidiphilus sp.]
MEAAATGILLDTTVLIDLLRHQKEAVAQVRELALRGFALAICPITVAELYAGMRKGEEQSTEELISAFQWLPLSRDVARKAGEIVAAKRRAGRTHALDDMMIAATAIHYGYSLLTENRKDFAVQGIQLYSE